MNVALRAIFLLPALWLSARADISLPALLTDHMVIQRDLPVHIWGRAAEAETVSVTFRGSSATAKADSVGRWSVYLPPGAAGGPFELSIRGTNEITLRDVLVGDVWVASGQSNMEFALRGADRAPEEIRAADHSMIRALHVEKQVAGYPLDDVTAAHPWTVCSPETAPDFSAVAYFFARELQARTGVAIGLIESSWGGTPVDAWTSLHAISSDASLMPVFASWARMTDDGATVALERERLHKEWEASVTRAKGEGKTPPGMPWTPNQNNSWQPAGLYNAMIAPLTRYPIRGVIWYQGESNASTERAPLYAHLFEAMIQDWRRNWGVGDFPFLFVQLANFKTGADARWPELREAQLQTLALRNTGMAVTIDIGNPADIHPKNKQDVGMRLALAARAVAYGEKLEYSGPILRSAATEGGSMRIWFAHTGTGLTAKGGPLRGFEVAGADRHFVPAEARVDGSTVVARNAKVEAPRYVRYGWADNPDCNLYNAEGLPASPFRSGE